MILGAPHATRGALQKLLAAEVTYKRGPAKVADCLR
jgi:hypothetical protein